MRPGGASDPLPQPVTPSTAHRTRTLKTILGFLFAASLVFARLGQIPLMDPDEGRNAEIAREMAASGRWLVPTYNGVPYLDKPALYFRLVATSLTAFGYSELAARLPSALFALALLVLVYRFCRREYGERTAVLSVVIVASMPLFLALARIVIFDMALAFFVCAAIFAGYRAEEPEVATRKRWYAVGAGLAGVATLVKGPVGFILPVVVLLACAAVERRRGVLRRILHPLNLVIFFALVLPWFVGLSLERPDFPYYGLVQESFERFTTPTFDRTGPFYYYVPVMAGVCFGWSCLFPDAAFLAWRRRSGWTRADRLFIVWAIAVPAFFSISQSKLPGYVLTAVVALGVLVARLFDRAFENPQSSSARVVRRGALFLMLGSVAALSWLTIEVLSPETLRTYFGLRGADYERARLLFPALLTPLAVLAAASSIASLTRNVTVAFGAFLLLPASLVTVSFGDVQSYALTSSSIRLAREVQSIAPEANVVCLECYPTGLAFYLRRELILVTADGKETTSNYIPYYLAHNEPWPPQIVPVSRFRQWLAERQFQALVLARGERAGTLARLAMSTGGRVRELSNGWRALLLPARHSH